MLTPINIQSYLNKAISFDSYFQEFENRVNQIKKGNTDIPFFEYYLLNFQRLKRGMKTVLTKELLDTISQINQKITFLIITEYWCGDAAQSLGIIKKMEEVSNGKVTLKLIFRDENLELMDHFLTNGGRSIPKVIQLNEDLDILDNWGPRPSEAQDMVQEILKEKKPYAEDLHKWYAKNKTVDLQMELNTFLKKGLISKA